LRATVEGGHEGGRWVGVCGELAGDELAIPLLVGLGFDELSMSPSRIPAAKALIRALDAERCMGLAERALACETSDEVEALVRAEISG
jgi:phosphoenolpyruvate-protein kinase (PTS system EI component)